MSAIYCPVPGAAGPSPRDLEIIEQVAAALERRVGSSGPLDPFFDGDVHLVAGDVTSRREFVVVDGKLQLP